MWWSRHDGASDSTLAPRHLVIFFHHSPFSLHHDCEGSWGMSAWRVAAGMIHIDERIIESNINKHVGRKKREMNHRMTEAGTERVQGPK